VTRPASILAFLAAAVPALGQEATGDLPPAPSYAVTRTLSSVEIDGELDEPVWADAEPIRLAWETFPRDNVEPPVESECRVTFDDAALYLGCVARDPEPEAIRAHLSDRDEGTQDDHFVFFLDPFRDRRRAFQFRVNPLGVQMDAMFTPGAGTDFSWDTIWDSAGRITEDGYVIEIAIPFRSLRFPDTEGSQTWGFIFERVYPRSSRVEIASGPQDRDNDCLLCQENLLHGLTGIVPGNDVEFDPTLTGTRTERRPDFPAGELEVEEEDLEPGLDARWGITPNVTLNATANPDFSQVEADAAQLEVNNRFALFFPEKRPFFLEGQDFFETPANLVFTRTVADPLVGGKVTGKVGAHAFGAFLTQDRVNNLIFPGSRGSDETQTSDDVTGFVGRYRRDVGESSTVGGIVTTRDAGEYSNRVAATDGFLRLSPRQSLEWLAGWSETEYPGDVARAFDQPEGSFGGHASSIEYEYESRRWAVEAGYEDVAEDFRADFGFVTQVDLRGPEGGVERIWWGDDAKWFDRISLEADARWAEDHDGFLVERQYTIAANYSGPAQISARLWNEWSSESFAGQIFDLVEPRFNFSMRPSGALALGVFVSAFGDEIDFANARVADELFVSPNLELRLGKPFRLEVDHTFQRLSEDDEEIFTANLTEVRALWHFNVRTFVRAIVQFRSTDRNPATFSREVESEEDRVFTQLLFSYKVNPQTVVFAGYTENRAATSEFDLIQADRTFFLKFGYAWRL